MSAIDRGLLSPVTTGHDEIVSDAAVLDALVTVEVALVRAWAAAGVAPVGAADAVSEALGWRGPGELCTGQGVDADALAAAAVAGGNPVIPLVAELKSRVPAEWRAWVHRGPTSQDIIDTALVLLAQRAVRTVSERLARLDAHLASLIEVHRDTVAAARTLTQHAVPTTWGARIAGWARGVQYAHRGLGRLEFPVQLAGAGGTSASFAEIARLEGGDPGVASALPGYLEAELRLAGAPSMGADLPWHVSRWPITQLGDALVGVTDALGKIAGDVANGARTEVGEVIEGVGGGSSAMPQKQNPVGAVLLRSAALRAPQLAATLHIASALAVDERPDGAWHAEWPTLRELLRLALGASAHGEALAAGLRIDGDAAARNLALTGGLIVSERLSLVLTPRIGKTRFADIVARAAAGADLAELVEALPEASDLDVASLLDPAQYTGRARGLAEDALAFDVDGAGEPA